MSDLCRYCGVISRNACSTYKREYLEEELSKCPNLYDEERGGALIRAGFYDAGRALDEARERDEELERLRAENAALRRRLS